MKSPAVLFYFFCSLIAFRDAFSHRLLEDVDPVFMLLVYFVSASVFAWLFKWLRTGNPGFVSPFAKLSKEQKITFAKLGITTWIVYVVTIFGIKELGATVFNIIDYGAMPILTLYAGLIMLQEKIAKTQWIGTIAALIGIMLFFLAPANLDEKFTWRFWIVVALVSPIFTSICSVYQKKQVDQGLHPDIVLLYRFPIPSFLMLLWFLIRSLVTSWNDVPVWLEWFIIQSGAAMWNDVPSLLFISFFGIFLPLLLLCFGFMQSSLSRFSPYLFLIPIMTFILGPLLVKGEWAKLTDIRVVSGMLLVLLGYMIAEGFGILRGSNQTNEKSY